MWHCADIIVNSKNRIETSTATDSNFSYNIRLPDPTKYTHVCITQASIPRSYYTIQSGSNTFTLSEPGIADITLTVPEGEYGRTSFQTVVAALLTAGSLASGHAWNYAISWPNISSAASTGKYTYTVTLNGGVQPSIIFPEGSTLYEQMGFADESTNVFVGDSLTSTAVVNLNREDTLFIHSDIIGGEGSSVLQAIFATGSQSYSSIRYDSYGLFINSKKFIGNSSNVYNFSLTNENNKLINLNGRNWLCVLRFYDINAIMPSKGIGRPPPLYIDAPRGGAPALPREERKDDDKN